MCSTDYKYGNKSGGNTCGEAFYYARGLNFWTNLPQNYVGMQMLWFNDLQVFPQSQVLPPNYWNSLGFMGMGACHETWPHTMLCVTADFINFIWQEMFSPTGKLQAWSIWSNPKWWRVLTPFKEGRLRGIYS